MSKKNKLLTILKEIAKVLNQKEDYKKKYNEIRIMRFKVQPYFGNLELLKKKKKEMVNTLWFLGKFEKIVNKYYSNISIDEVQKILDYVKTLKEVDLNEKEKTSIKEAIEENKALEMEIYQDPKNKKIIN
jgi:hypothetical protein